MAGWLNFFIKSFIVNILCIADHRMSVSTAQQCYVTDREHMTNGCGSVPVTLYEEGPDWPGRLWLAES